MNTILSIFYRWISPVYNSINKQENTNILIKQVDDYNNYIDLIMRCIGYNNKIILEIILNADELLEFKTRLIEDNELYRETTLTKKEFLINYALNPVVDYTISKMILKFFNENLDIDFDPKSEYIFKNGKLIDKKSIS